MKNTATTPAYTKGPWLIEPVKDGTVSFLITLEDQSDIATVGAGMHEGNPEGAEANARLIAAAPELLESVEHSLVYLEQVLTDLQTIKRKDSGFYRKTWERLQKSRHAIAKAYGKAR